MITRKAFHEACKLLKQKVDNNRHSKYSGICQHLSDILKVDYRDFHFTMKSYSKSWKHYSGLSCYPVPSPTKAIDALNAYYQFSNKWDGTYGNYRRDLLDYLIKRSEYSTMERVSKWLKAIFNK
jgi:hypothetical protein